MHENFYLKIRNLNEKYISNKNSSYDENNKEKINEKPNLIFIPKNKKYKVNLSDEQISAYLVIIIFYNFKNPKLIYIML